MARQIFPLEPVLRGKRRFNAYKILQFGLMAEQVEKVNSDLVARDDEGKPYTMRYEVVSTTGLTGFLKEHRKVEE